MKRRINIWVYSLMVFSMFCLLTESCKKNDDDNTTLGETVTDIDGNVYHTVRIGTQVWMKENLAVTHYRNGDPVLNITDNDRWLNADSGAYCNYDNDASIVKTYGRLYNWYAVNDSRMLSPAGWHIPTDDEWKQLELFLGMTQEQADGVGFRGTTEGGKLKETGTSHWFAPNTGATNSSGFSALPGGYRIDIFSFQTIYGNWWTTTKASADEAIFRAVSYDKQEIVRNYYHQDEILGLSIRCIKD